jgi:hypothetical protein
VVRVRVPMDTLRGGWVVVQGVDDRRRDRLCCKNPLRGREPVLVSHPDNGSAAQTARDNCEASD